jgi:hypothetical protein
MTASRGDRKPCTAANCAGTMQFGRRSDNYARTPVVRSAEDRLRVGMDDQGWVCDTDSSHSQEGGEWPAATAT